MLKPRGQMWEARIRFEASSWQTANKTLAKIRHVIRGMFRVMGLRFAMKASVRHG